MSIFEEFVLYAFLRFYYSHTFHRRWLNRAEMANSFLTALFVLRGPRSHRIPQTCEIDSPLIYEINKTKGLVLVTL